LAAGHVPEQLSYVFPGHGFRRYDSSREPQTAQMAPYLVDPQ